MKFSNLNLNPLCNSIVAALLIFSVAMCGCDEPKKAAETEQEAEHFHVHGPHAQGECFRFTDNTDFAMEVVLQGQNEFVRVLFTAHDGKSAIEFAAESLTLKRSSDDENGFQLTAIAGEEEGKLKGFELEDAELRAAIKLPMMAKITIDGTEFNGTTKPGH